MVHRGGSFATHPTGAALGGKDMLSQRQRLMATPAPQGGQVPTPALGTPWRELWQ